MSNSIYVEEKVLLYTTFDSEESIYEYTSGIQDWDRNGSQYYDSIDGWTPVSGSTVIETHAVTDPNDPNTLASGGVYSNRYIELNDLGYGYDSFYNHQSARGITQIIETEPGLVHTISFEYSPRPQYDESVNTFEILIDGVSVGSFSDDYSDWEELLWNTSAIGIWIGKWQDGEVSFIADSDGYTEITFIENSNNDQLEGRGMFIDNIEIVQDAYYYDPTSTVDNEVDESAANSDNPVAIYVLGDYYYADFLAIESDFLIGNDVGNVIWAYQGADIVDGEGGNDSLYGNKGDDTLTGGWGSDWLYGGQDQDLLYGNQDDDTLYGHKGDDIVYAGRDDDALYGNQGSDELYGNHGDDMIFGGQGDDYLDGGSGDDLLWGNKGADFFYLSAGDDVIFDFSSAGGDFLVGDSTSTLSYQQIGADLLVLHDEGSVLLTNTLFGVEFSESIDVILL